MNNKSWIFLFVAFFIIGLFLGNALTGKVVKVNSIGLVPTIRLDPFRVSNGDIMKVEIDSRDKGANVWFTLRNDKGVRVDKVFYCRGIDDFGESVINTGGDNDSKCYSKVTMTYTIPYELNKGVYYIEIDKSKAYFEVV